MLRKAKVVGKFVEFFGEGAASLAVHRPRDHRQHGARVRRDDGLLPGRRGDLPVPARRPAAAREHVDDVRATTTRRRASSASRATASATTREVLELDLVDRAAERRRAPSARRTASTLPRPEGPLPGLLLASRSPTNGYGKDRGDARPSASPRRSAAPRPHGGGSQKPASISAADAREHQRLDREPRWRTTARRPDRVGRRRPSRRRASTSATATSLIAAITSCTNTSNPSVMLAAGLLAKKAVERGPDGLARA